MPHDPIDYLARTYFHQDYDLEAPSPAEVLVKFREDESVDMVDDTRIALADALSSGTEAVLADLWLRRAGAFYDPRTEGMSMTAWFSVMVDVLRSGATS